MGTYILSKSTLFTRYDWRAPRKNPVTPVIGTGGVGTALRPGAALFIRVVSQNELAGLSAPIGSAGAGVDETCSSQVCNVNLEELVTRILNTSNKATWFL